MGLEGKIPRVWKVSMNRQRIHEWATDGSALERKIDDLVYQLYGLTAEEIRVVEGA